MKLTNSACLCQALLFLTSIHTPIPNSKGAYDRYRKNGTSTPNNTAMVRNPVKPVVMTPHSVTQRGKIHERSNNR